MPLSGMIFNDGVFLVVYIDEYFTHTSPFRSINYIAQEIFSLTVVYRHGDYKFPKLCGIRDISN